MQEKTYLSLKFFLSMHTVNRCWYEKLYVVCRLLSSPTCPVLDALGKKLSFEIAVGLNGRVWVCRYLPFNSSVPYYVLFSLLLVSFEAWYMVDHHFMSWILENFILLISACLFQIVISSRSMLHLHLQLSSSLMQLWTQRHWVVFNRE